MIKKVKRLGISKASYVSEIPTKILNASVDLFSPFLLNFVNMSITSHEQAIDKNVIRKQGEQKSEY